jgi:hypothetical protein
MISRPSGSWTGSASLVGVRVTFVRRGLDFSGPSPGGSEPLLGPASALGALGGSGENENSVGVMDVEDTRRLTEARLIGG